MSDVPTAVGAAMVAAAREPDPRAELGLVRRRRLVDGQVDVTFALSPGDRALVAAGESIVAGTPIIERLRDVRLLDRTVPASAEPRPGGRLPDGELLFEWRGRWRIAGGELDESVDSPLDGIVRDVRPGSAIVITASGRALRAIVALGGPTSGRLHVAAWVDGELRANGLDVGLAGSILVVGSRIDAETIIRARAMGVRGIVVAGLASKERRDFVASEARQRAALHRLSPFAVLVLEGAVRRSLPSPVTAVLRSLEGRQVAIVGDPPLLVFDAAAADLPQPADDFVRVRAGPLAGREGTWAGLIGQRRFPGGVHLEAGSVRLEDGSVVAVPLGDLERFG